MYTPPGPRLPDGALLALGIIGVLIVGAFCLYGNAHGLW